MGSQANVRSSILGETGSAQEVRREFLVLFEDAVREIIIYKSVQRFQLSIQEAQVKPDLGTWLMPSPSNLVLNTEAKTAYNNVLQRASSSMKLGDNSDVNRQIKTVGIRRNLGISKVKLIPEHKESESVSDYVIFR